MKSKLAVSTSDFSIRRDASLTFYSFVRANRALLTVVVSIWAAIYLIGLFTADIHFFYSWLRDDSLLYYLHGWYLLHFHTTVLRLADNIAPYQYVGAPGYLRIPFLLVSNNFATQLRLIQISNLILLAVLGVLSSYLLWLRMPENWKRLAVPWMFGSLLLSMPWETNVFLPLSDIFFSLFLCGAIAAIRSHHISLDGLKFDWKLPVIAILVLCAASIKFFGFLLPVYAVLCWLPDLTSRRISRKLILGATLIVGGIGIVGMFMWKTVLAYGAIWTHRIHATSLHDWILNLLAISIPDQIIPSFHYLYSSSLTGDFLTFHWATSARDSLVMMIGIAIAALTGIGAVFLRKRYLPEIFLFFAFLLIAMPITTSTTRYLMPLQFISIPFFLGGVQCVVPHRIPKSEPRGSYFIGIMAVLFVFLIAIHGVGSKGRYLSSVPLLQTEKNISATYISLDSFLSRQASEHTRLLYFSSDSSSPGKWTAIRGLHYVAPDSNLQFLVRSCTVYAVFDHPRRVDSGFRDGDDLAMLSQLSHWGRFKVDLVLDAGNSNAFGRIYRITADDAPAQAR